MFKNLRMMAPVCAVVACSAFSQSTQAAEVYMLRGFPSAYSDGMKKMAEKLNKQGIKTKVSPNAAWAAIANDIIRRSKSKEISYPIIMVGHSMGGVAAARVANTLGKQGIETALIIGLDPGFPTPQSLKKGAKEVVNYKLKLGQDYRGGKGFTGRIKTIDATKYDAEHTNIDDNEKIQSLVISHIRRKAGR